MKNSISIVVILILLLVIFKGFLYRLLISYEEKGIRDTITLTDQNLQREIDIWRAEQTQFSINKIMDFALELTSDKLHFINGQTTSNPNTILKSGKSNCVGYSRLTNSIIDYIIRKENLDSKLEVIHKVGLIKVFGINIHNFIEDPFWKDHDYNVIKDKINQEYCQTDPTLFDYLGINRIIEQKQKIK